LIYRLIDSSAAT